MANYIASLKATPHASKTYLTTALICTLFMAPTSFAASETVIENPAQNNQLLNDTWVVEYEADDFTDEVEKASVLFIPKDFTKEAAFVMRCKSFYTNFKIEYVENKNNLLEDGELPNASSSFAKHGFVYDTEQELSVSVGGNKESYDISVGGQKNYLSKSFKTKQKIQSDELGMSLFFTFVAKEMPSFRADSTTDEALDFNAQLKKAINSHQPMQFTVESDNGWQREFNLDTARMLKTVPNEVIDFCVTGRKLK